METSPNGDANGSAAPAAAATTATTPDTKTDPSISWPVNRPASRGKWTPEVDHEIRQREQTTAAAMVLPGLSTTTNTASPTAAASSAAASSNSSGNNHRSPSPIPAFPVTARDLLPGQPRSLSGIGFRAFLLGQALGASLVAATYLGLVAGDAVWRAPFFVATLAAFHFLEFWTTARWNTPVAKTASFLFSNGKEYQMAHSAAMLEHLVSRFFFPAWQERVMGVAGTGTGALVGVVLIVVGQAVRSVAMAQAGTNFNHIVQSRKNRTHELVTHGVYAWLRHPSYFGFFWWGLGTQLMLGNVVCFLIYAVVLWQFFNHRIKHEEKFLINFFGDEYIQYRARTKVAIPFIP